GTGDRVEVPHPCAHLVPILYPQVPGVAVWRCHIPVPGVGVWRCHIPVPTVCPLLSPQVPGLGGWRCHIPVFPLYPPCPPPVPAGARAGRVEVPRSVTAVLGQDVVLPCRYRAQEQEQVVQVTWLKRGTGGAVPAEVAVLNPQHGEHVQEPFAGRVLRHGHGALEDGAIVLRNAVQGDEGDYECHLITFPMGSFEGRLTLRVLVPPLPILNPGPPLEEGQGRTLAASCTAEGSPVPSVRWETEVRGTNATRRSAHARSASVTSEFFLVPGRSMNGKSLTCVVAHPGLRHEKRITHTLSVA
ncbi:nectin-4, partial [Corapipo altera]|uniref:nectin-4 n=1 Tax=Corapipo altera TaxID=415028 RepID=UPI000FD62288